MEVETKTTVLVGLCFNPAGYRQGRENNVLWEKAYELDEMGQQIFCITSQDLGFDKDSDVCRTKYQIHTTEGACGHKSVHKCNSMVEGVYGVRYGVLSESPGHIVYDRKNIPHINKLRATPKRVRFPLHGSYVDVPAEIIGKAVGA